MAGTMYHLLEIEIPLLGLELLFPLGVGLVGGVMNSTADGGSFITFPALLFVGISHIVANATNT
ncbi:MAG: putative membrane protein YfcA [Halioglobus sp.]|jgi:uncharacterized membrane protein YfcA